MIELNPYIILSKPQLGENIGSTARAMKNFGIKNLLLVQPRDGWPNNAAFAPAAGADDVLNQAKLYDSISEATKQFLCYLQQLHESVLLGQNP